MAEEYHHNNDKSPIPSLYVGDCPAVGVLEHKLVAAAVLGLHQLRPGVELSLHLPHLHHLQHILTQGAALVCALLPITAFYLAPITFLLCIGHYKLSSSKMSTLDDQVKVMFRCQNLCVRHQKDLCVL